MQITKIECRVTKKINLGNYETKDYSLTAEVSLDTGERVSDVADMVKQELEQKLQQWEDQVKQPLPNQLPTIVDTRPPTPIKDKDIYICPICKEPMKKKEGKEYYMCSLHWGYPAMIEKGDVRVKQFKRPIQQPSIPA